MYFSSHSSDKQYFSLQKIDENVVFLATTHDKSGLTRRELPCVVTRNETLSGYRYCIPFIVDLLTIKVYPRSKSCKPPFQKVFFSHTVVPESLFWKLSIRKTFFANSRSRKLSLQTVVSHTTPVLKINNHAPGGWRTKDILGGPKSLETKKLGSSKGTKGPKCWKNKQLEGQKNI